MISSIPNLPCFIAFVELGLELCKWHFCLVPTPTTVRLHLFPNTSGKGGLVGDWEAGWGENMYVLAIQVSVIPAEGLLPDSSSCPQAPRTSHFAAPWGCQLQPDGTLSMNSSSSSFSSKPLRHQQVQDGSALLVSEPQPLLPVLAPGVRRLCHTVCPFCFFSLPKGVSAILSFKFSRLKPQARPLFFWWDPD